MSYGVFIGTVLAEASAEHAGQIQRLADNFGVDGPFLLAQIINFSVVAFIIYFFGFKPVLQTINQRQQKIAGGLQYAEEMKAQLAEAEKQCREKLTEATKEGQAILQEARESAKSYTERQMQEAINNAEAVIEKAQAAIALEKQTMLDEGRKELAQLVVKTTAKVLSKELSSDDVQRFGESAVKSLKSL